MVMSKRVYIALFAVLTELVAIAATGNQGVTDFVADHMATSPLGDLFLRSVPSFPWRFTGDPGVVLAAQWVAIATFVVVTFLLTLLVVRGAATFSGPFFAAVPIVVGSSLVAHVVANIVDYDKVGRLEHTGLGRVGYSLFNSNSPLAIMYSLMCGIVVAIVVGIVGLVLRRRAARSTEVDAPLFAPGMGTAAYGPPTDSGGFAAPGGFVPGTQPWQTESYAPQSYAPQSYAPAADQPADVSAAGFPAPGRVLRASASSRPVARCLWQLPTGRRTRRAIDLRAGWRRGPERRRARCGRRAGRGGRGARPERAGRAAASREPAGAAEPVRLPAAVRHPDGAARGGAG